MLRKKPALAATVRKAISELIQVMNAMAVRQEAMTSAQIPLIVTPGGESPKRHTDGAAGYDLTVREVIELRPGVYKCPVGIRLAIPQGWVGLLWPRSSALVKHDIQVMTGVIDSDFRGELAVVCSGARPDVGQCLAQIVFFPFGVPAFVATTELPETVRGEGGFGSTDATGGG